MRKRTVEDARRVGVLLPSAGVTWGSEQRAELRQGSETVASFGITWHTPERVTLRYRVGAQDARYPVMLTSAPCNYGGRRWWWVCPACSGRAVHLYLPDAATDDPRLLCRECRRLTYTARQCGHRAAELVMMRRRFARLHTRLQAAPPDGRIGFDRTVPGRPARMHYRTYAALTGEIIRLQDLGLWEWHGGMARRFPQAYDGGAYTPQEVAAFYRDELARYRQERGEYRRRYQHIRRPRRLPVGPPLTAGELATCAGVPRRFVMDAQRAGVLRPDSGRKSRRWRYRRRLVGWVRKLATLHAEGMTWPAIATWTRDRWKLGADGSGDAAPQREAE
jgi:hypothetical protein